MLNDARVEINSSLDIVNARQQGRALAQKLGFVGSEVTLIAAAISEVARNIVEYARRGEITFVKVQDGARRGSRSWPAMKDRGYPTWCRRCSMVIQRGSGRELGCQAPNG